MDDDGYSRRWFDLTSPWWRAWAGLLPLLFVYGVGETRGLTLAIICAVLIVPPFWWMAISPTAQRRFTRDHPVAEAAWGSPILGFFAMAALFPDLELTIVGLLAAAYALLVVGGSVYRRQREQAR